MEIKKVLVNKAYWNRAKKQCTRCGETFYVQPSKFARFAMCRPCRSRTYHSPVDLICVRCDQPFTVKGHLRTVQRFCSVKCRWSGFKLDYPERGPEWKQVSKTIRERDHHQCQHCGRLQSAKLRLNVHHSEPYRISQNDDPANLITLCLSCHKAADSAYEREHP